MTREDVRYYLRSSGFSEEQINTIEQALEQEPCDDAVSREDAIHAFDYLMGLNRAQIQDILLRLPSVKPQICNDAVSRDAVKELIKSGVSTDTYDDVEQVCKWIDALPPVTQKPDNKYRKEAKRWKNKWLKSQKSRWIPVSERLPETGEEVLACGHDTYNKKVIISRYQGRQYGFTCGLVSAWMPLPKPFEP